MAEKTTVPSVVKKELSAIKGKVKEAKKVPVSVKKNIQSLKKEVKKTRAVPNIVKKQIKQIKNLVSKVKTASTKNQRQVDELGKLKKDIEGLKKKGLKKKQLSEYNLFIKRQLIQGRTFLQAVRLWKRQHKATQKLRKASSKTKAKPPAVAAKRPVAVRQKKPVKKKPARQKKPKPKRLSRRTLPVSPFFSDMLESLKKSHKESSDKSLARFDLVQRRLSELLLAVRQNQKDFSLAKSQFDVLGSRLKNSEKSFSFSKNTVVSADGGEEPSDEELAVKLAHLYFREVARLGFKRSLELDDVINAYFYSIARIRRKEIEARQIMDAMKKTGNF